MGVKVEFNSKGIMKDLKKQIEKNPQILFKQNAGKSLDAECPKCGHNGLKINSTGDAVCPQCHTNIKIELEVK